MLLLFGGVYFAQASPDGRPQNQAAYPESEAAAAWRGLAASYVRKALEDQKLGKDPTLNARVDTVMAAVGAAVAAIDSRFANSSWGAILIEDFGHGAAAFPGETILVDAKFVRTLQLSDDELALIFSREADTVGAAIFFATGYDSQRALGLFDKLAELEAGEDGRAPDSHDAARVRKQAVAGVIAELQQFLARRGSEAR